MAEFQKTGKWIGALVKKLRGERDRKSLAVAAGVDPTNLKRLEDGLVESPGFDFVVSLARVLNVPVSTFVKTRK